MFFIYVYVNSAVYSVPSHYGVESGELAGYALAVIAPAAAAAAAWEAGRHRSVHALNTTSTRGAVRRLVAASLPVLTLHLALIATALICARVWVGVWPGDAGWLAVAHLLIVPAEWALIGWFLGQLMPKSVAAALIAGGCWMWLAMPQATANAWVRHLGGFIDGTSTVTDLRQPSVYTIPWLITAGFVLAAGCAASARRHPWTIGLGICAVIASLMAGHALVSGWGYTHPTSMRTVTQACSGRAPRICAPPEYKPYLDKLRREAAAPVERLAMAGVAAPDELRVTSSRASLRPGVWPLYWSLPPAHPMGQQQDFAYSLAESAVAGTAIADGGADCQAPGSLAAAWADLVIGVDEADIRQAMAPQAWTQLHHVRGLPAGEQVRWFTEQATSKILCPSEATS
ncbi:hypothetical protein [Streptomyces sp. NPDC050392]|uniref:DUF7224 domain-containing protein n=1 Tax=Streptomyces sp. NPDC050392 TaxID=3155782 RepID=UPI0034380F20